MVQAVPERMEPSNWGDRVGAYVIDGACTLALAMVAYLAVATLTGGSAGLDDPDEQAWAVAAFWTAIVNYSPVLNARSGSRSGQTLGRQAHRLRAVRVDGRRLTFGRALARHLAHLLLTLIAPLGLINHLWPLWDKRKQTLHDKLARTVVVDAAYLPADAGGRPVAEGFSPAGAVAVARAGDAWLPPPAPAAPQPLPPQPQARAGGRTGAFAGAGAICALLAVAAVWLVAGDGSPGGDVVSTEPGGRTPATDADSPSRPEPEVRERPRLELYKLVRRLEAAGDIDGFEPIEPRNGYQAEYELDDGAANVAQKVLEDGSIELAYEYLLLSNLDKAIEREASKLGFGDFEDVDVQ